MLTTRLRFLKKSPIAAILALLLVSAFSHTSWLDPFNTFTHTDWAPWFSQSTKEFTASWSAGAWDSYSDLGAPNVQINFFGFYGFGSILANLGLPINVTIWLIFLLPILVLQVVGPFLLLQKL